MEFGAQTAREDSSRPFSINSNELPSQSKHRTAPSASVLQPVHEGIGNNDNELISSLISSTQSLSLDNEDTKQKLRSLFRKFDDDNSGVIDSLELRKAVKAFLGVELDHENTILLIMRFDEDKNMVINESEFFDLVAVVLEMKNKFKEIDTDSGSSLNSEEIMKWLNTSFGFKLPEKAVQSFVGIFDEDKSGAIDYQEFFNLSLYINELHYQFNKMTQKLGARSVGAEDWKWIKSVLGHEKANDEFIRNFFLDQQQKRTFEDFILLIADYWARRKKEINRAPKITKLRRVKAPNRELKRVPKAQRPEVLQEIERMRQKLNGQKFEDPQFPPSPALLPSHSRDRVKSWRRITDIHPDASLFVDGVEEGDVVQGRLGTCWLLSSLSVMATGGSELMKEMFVHSIPDLGIYQLKFMKDGEWRIVTIDDRLPCDQNGTPIFAKCRDPKEFWVSLIEKAFAKLHGSFSAIETGVVSHALKDFTGEGVEIISLDSSDGSLSSSSSSSKGEREDLWQTLVTNMCEGYLMGCSFISPSAGVEEKTSHGLLLNHAYGIIDCQEVSGGHKLIRLRNPWGNEEWKGRWSDGAKEWTPELMKHFNYEFDNDGTFFMCFEDFVKYFNRIDVLRLMTDNIGEIWNKMSQMGEWTPSTSGGSFNFPSFVSNPQYYFEPLDDTRVFISLSQPDRRYRDKVSPADVPPHLSQYFPIGICVLRASSSRFRKTELLASDMVHSTVYLPDRDISLEWKAKKGEKYIIIPSTFQSGQLSKFDLSIYTQKLAKFIPLLHLPPPDTILTASWTRQYAGGCINFVTWKDNPQFYFRVDQSDAAAVARKPFDLSRPVTVSITLETTSDKFSIGFYVFKVPVDWNERRLLTCEDLVYMAPKFSKKEMISAEIKLQRGGKGYILVPSTFSPGEQQPLRVKLSASDDMDHDEDMGNGGQLSVKVILTHVKEWDRKIIIPGQWNNTCAGGCHNNNTSFMNNPKYVVSLASPSSLGVVLSVPLPPTQPSTSSSSSAGATTPQLPLPINQANGQPLAPIGFYLFEFDRNRQRIGKFISRSNFPSGACHVSFSFNLVGGDYLLIPCTFYPGNFSPFSLEIYSLVDFQCFQWNL